LLDKIEQFLGSALNRRISKILLIFTCFIFSYGGVVNLGWSGFIMALPFMYVWYIWARKWGQPYTIATIILALLLVPLYVAKKRNADIFYPAIGKEIVLIKDACYYQLRSDSPDSETSISVSDSPAPSDCLKEESMGYRKKPRIVRAGTKHKITRIDVSHSEFEESYVIRALDSEGLLYISSYDYASTNSRNALYKYVDGSPISEDSLRQPFFYYPSLLMLWPAIPILILSLPNILLGRIS
jgi:hypothetical protein